MIDWSVISFSIWAMDEVLGELGLGETRKRNDLL